MIIVQVLWRNCKNNKQNQNKKYGKSKEWEIFCDVVVFFIPFLYGFFVRSFAYISLFFFSLHFFSSLSHSQNIVYHLMLWINTIRRLAYQTDLSLWRSFPISSSFYTENAFILSTKKGLKDENFLINFQKAKNQWNNFLFFSHFIFDFVSFSVSPVECKALWWYCYRSLGAKFLRSKRIKKKKGY